MMIRPHRLLFVLALLMLLSPRRPEATEGEGDVEKKIDAIIDAPEYDWLRQSEQTEENGDGERLQARGRSRKYRYVQTGAESSGCGYRMGPPLEQKQAKPSSCENKTPGSCDNPSIGECNFKPSIGSCGSLTIGGFGSAVGYILGSLLLFGILTFVIWAIMKAEKTRPKKPSPPIKTDLLSDKATLKDASTPPVDLMLSQAEKAASRGDYRKAIGLAYLAGIGMLHRAGHVNLGLSTTNLEILTSVKGNGGPHKFAKKIINLFEEVYFGGKRPTQTHWDTCRSTLEKYIV